MEIADLIGEDSKPIIIEKARVNEFVDLVQAANRFRECAEIVGLCDGKLAEHISRVGSAMFIGRGRARNWWALFPLPPTADKDSHGLLADALTNEPKPVE